MRWSLVYLTGMLAASSVLDGILCAPVDTLELEARGPKIKPPKANKPAHKAAQNATKKVKALVDKNKLGPTSYKFYSGGYRKAALKNKFSYTKNLKKKGKVEQVATSKKRAANMDADHILEGQTVHMAVKAGGYSTKSALGQPALDAVKAALNDPSNMAYLDKDVNIKKGQLHKSALAGGNPTIDSHVKDYMQQTADRGKNTAQAVDDALKKHGITGVDVQGTHKKVLDAAGIKRRGYVLDELD